jgi:leucyl/phenylalanyl-tRNA--protein transferase
MEQPLTPELLVLAYANGYFPMPGEDEMLWYQPDPRAILPLDGFHCSRSLTRTLRREKFSVTFDKDFAGVVSGCADRETTWINDEIKSAYQALHERHFAHSVEVWNANKLVGGVYGVALGAAFFAESMFHRETDASKVALYHLVQRLRSRSYSLLEVQFLTPHLASLGVVAIPSEEYLALLKKAIRQRRTFTP